MKKVLCINHSGWMRGGNKVKIDGPKYMEECTVLEVSDEKSALHLSEYPIIDGAKGWWLQSQFIPLSDKDETEYADEILEQMFVPVQQQQSRNVFGM